MRCKTVIEQDGTIQDFFDWVKCDGSTDYQPESGRYHVYGQHFCPYANRVTIGRVLKGLEKAISYDNVDYVLPVTSGWKFTPEKEGCDADSINGCKTLREVYESSAKKHGATGYSGKVTVPVLYDKKLGRIVSNDSASILRMFNSEFNEFCATQAQKDLDLFPESLRSKIEEVEDWTHKSVVFGVYDAWSNGAQTQEAYDQAIANLFDGLDKLEELLSKNRFLTGKQMTEADIRLFVTLIRFDKIFNQLRCSKKRVTDYPALWAYTRDIYQTGKIREVVLFDEIVKGYFLSYYAKIVNPYGIIPALPDINYDEPAYRENM